MESIEEVETEAEDQNITEKADIEKENTVLKATENVDIDKEITVAEKAEVKETVDDKVVVKDIESEAVEEAVTNDTVVVQRTSQDPIDIEAAESKASPVYDSSSEKEVKDNIEPSPSLDGLFYA